MSRSIRTRQRRATPWTALSAVALGLVALAGATHAEPRGVDDAAVRAVIDREGGPLAVGVVGQVTISVRTPEGHRVHPVELPPLHEAEIVRHDSEIEEHPGGGWLHRTQVRIRPLAAGPLLWPATELSIESPSGERTRLQLDERVYEVHSVMRGVEDPRPPYGLRALEGRDDTWGGFGAGLASGAGLSAAAALLWVWRRRRAVVEAPVAPDPPAPAPTDPLADARQSLLADPREAANRAAAVLRTRAGAYFRADLSAQTTDELGHLRLGAAPPEMRRALVAVLARLDACRFRDGAATTDAVSEALDEAEGLLRRMRPGSES